MSSVSAAFTRSLPTPIHAHGTKVNTMILAQSPMRRLVSLPPPRLPNAQASSSMTRGHCSYASQ
jgi:hypothetical protein